MSEARLVTWCRLHQARYRDYNCDVGNDCDPVPAALIVLDDYSPDREPRRPKPGPLREQINYGEDG